MTRRARLRVLVKTGLLIAVLAFAVVFFRGLLAPGPEQRNVMDLSGIAPGSARLEAWNGTPVWVVNRTGEQVRSLSELRNYVATPRVTESFPVANPERSLRPRYGIYLARTARPGILVQYTRSRPASLPAGAPWAGGFVDPATGAAFDVAGRRYRGTRGRPLEVPPYRYVGTHAVRLGRW